MINGTQIIVLVAREVAKESHETILPVVALIITDFTDMFLKDLLDQLPPMRNIQHAIDLVSRATLLNLLHYQMNLMEQVKLQRQVEKLLSRRFIQESLSPCAFHTLLTPKEDGTWWTYVNSRVINKITIKYHFFQFSDWMICLTWCSVPQSFQRMIWRVVTIKFKSARKMNRRQHLRRKMTVWVNGHVVWLV